MFEQNIKELEKKNPALAKKIKAHPYEKIKSIEVYDSESKNLIISYNGVLLHSSEDPLRETKSIWHKTIKNEMQNNDIVVIYGLGLGYLFKRAYVSTNARILLFEPSLDILRFVFENVDFSTELADDRVFFVDNQEDATKFFENKYLSGDKIEVLFLPSYLELDQKGLLDLSSKLFQTIKDKNIDQNTSLLFSKLTTQNLLTRIFNIANSRPVNALKNSCQDKTALIIAAGPSLRKDLAIIKKHREKFIVIAILPTLPLLKEQGIEPDFLTVADPMNQFFKIEQYKDQLQNINIVKESRADLNLETLNLKSSFVYFPTIDKISQTILESTPKNKIELLPSCASVAILSFRLAQLLGCKEIVFSGLDLALTGGQFYAETTSEITNQTENGVVLKTKMGTQAIVLATTKSANGSEVKTREDYLLSIREFEKIVQENPDIKIINTAVDGALIKGMTYQTMEKIVKNLKKIDLDIDSIIEKTADANLKGFKKEALKLFANTVASFKEIKETFVKTVSTATELIDELAQEKPNMEKFAKTYNESQEIFSTARTFATRDLILSSYMQAEIAEFVTSYHKDTQITLEILKENLETERKLFEKTLSSLEDIILILDKNKK